jgi:hypothetical protein
MRPPELSDVTFRPAADAAERDRGRRLQAAVYRSRGFIPDVEWGDMLVDDYVEVATYFAAVTGGGEVIGSARLIPGAAVVPPTLSTFHLNQRSRETISAVGLDRVAEIASLATDPTAPYPSFGVSAGLYRAMLHHSLSSGRRHDVWVAAVEPALLRILHKVLRIPLDIIGDAGPYFGAERTPIRIDLVPGMTHVRRHEPEVWDYFQTGMLIDLTSTDVPAAVRANHTEG